MYLFLRYFPSAYSLSYAQNIILDKFNGIFIYLFIYQEMYFCQFQSRNPKKPLSPNLYEV